MPTTICQNFVQNAWKKELCSNCFKSKDEHNLNIIRKPIELTPKKKIESIIKFKAKTTKLSVSFTNETKVIGYGGEDWPDSNEEFEDTEIDYNYEETDSEPDDDQHKELLKVTKTNTEFNSVNANLLTDNNDIKKSYTHLKLGTPQVDSDGRKQTLLVSVTPFGQPEFLKKASKPTSFIPVAINNTNKNEEKSLLEEITETLEKGQTAIQIISRKRLASVDDKNKDATYLLERAAEKSAEKIKDLKLNKTNIPERKNGLTRATIIKRDQEKPAVFQTSTAKIELLNNKNLMLNKEMSNKTEATECDKTEEMLVETSNNVSNSNENDISEDSGNSLTESLNDAQETREQAGEPDGQADPEPLNIAIEPPALPTTPPPPIETRTSFLHGIDKPKLPVKPSTVLVRKPVNVIDTQMPQQTFTTFAVEAKIPDDHKLTINGKRKAPRPPLMPEQDLKRLDLLQQERASSCSPEPRSLVTPEPTPRLSLSLSTDSLCDVKSEEKKKEKSKGRFSLKKFLRMTSSKDLKHPESPKYEEVKYIEQPIKPRLVIVHPLELNGAKVEVVDRPFLPQDYQPLYIKPPPPPRNIDDSNARRLKPNLPHPPKSLDIINKQKYLDNRSINIKNKMDSHYANIGEVRSSITPNKPQRTASMREREALAAAQQNYEPIDVSPSDNKEKENVYDYINGARSSSPECEVSSSPEKNSPTSSNENKVQRGLRQSRSNSNMDVSGDYFKFQNIPRSASLTYCGSETESEIYSPYSFCGSESEIAEDDGDWPPTGKTHKLRSRKGRSIVHKNLEDNYGAVVIANHEALAQVLENIQQGPPIQPALRGLKAAPNLRWSDFSIKDNIIPLTVGHRIFHQAIWGAHHVTLIIYTGSTPTTPLSLGTFSLVPITEFTDLVPVKYLPFEKDGAKVVQASISVLPWIQVHTIQTYVDLLRIKSASSTQEELFKDACFILLQLVNALKVLQAQGIEELPLSLTSFVIYREMDKDAHHRLCVLQGLGETTLMKDFKLGSLCSCATSVLMLLLSHTKLTPLLRSLLNTERAVSLTQVKSVLEFTLWGPSDVPLSNQIKDRELALQRWLDLQRATVLHGLVCARIQLTVYEECHLLFLVRSNSKMICDASLLVDSSYKQNGLKC